MRSLSVVVVDHYDSYTYNLVHLVAEVTGRLPEVVQHDRVSAEEVLRHDAVVLSPGPGHPADPGDFSVGGAVIRSGDRPVLGVCLGMQGMVTTLGGEVVRGRPAHGEVATVQHDGRGVFTGLPQGFDAVRYHSLRAVAVPDCLEVTAICVDEDDPGVDGAETPAGEVVMGVRHRTLPLEGVQFHPESILSQHGLQMVRSFLDRCA